jgi:hypothetical protein
LLHVFGGHIGDSRETIIRAVRILNDLQDVARARAAKTGCLVQLPRQTAHRIFAGERWTTLHGVNADFCQALAPLGEFFAESKISRLI